MTAFTLLSLFLGLLSLLYSYLFLTAAKKSLAWIRKFPRMVLPGMILGIICLVWSARHTCIMLEGPLQRFHFFVNLLVPVGAVLCYFFLDYLTARSLGGLMILIVNYLLHGAFVHDIPGRGLYSAVCLFLGIAGLILVGTPWRLRQALEYACTHIRAGIGAGTVFGVCGLVLIVQTVLGLL